MNFPYVAQAFAIGAIKFKNLNKCIVQKMRELSWNKLTMVSKYLQT